MTPFATLQAVGRVFLDASLEVVPYFLLAILLGAVIEEFVSQRTIARFLTGRRPGTMLLASTTGALIPLCTCGMVPLAASLRRRGGDVKHTLAFLTAGAAVSFPVLILTWRILGARWMLVRFAASVVFGLAVGYAGARSVREAGRPGSEATVEGPPVAEGFEEVAAIRTSSRARSVWRRFLGQLREYVPWVLVSLALASLVDVLVPRHWIHVLYGAKTQGGPLIAALTGLPFYFCSGAELPLVKELLGKGMGVASAASMQLAVPIVNLLTLGVVTRWLGAKGALVYLALCVAGAAVIGALYGAIAG
jgi:uncharacterized membrane protein YraQ (UPF0718 family)